MTVDSEKKLLDSTRMSNPGGKGFSSIVGRQNDPGGSAPISPKPTNFLNEESSRNFVASFSSSQISYEPTEGQLSPSSSFLDKICNLTANMWYRTFSIFSNCYLTAARTVFRNKGTVEEMCDVRPQLITTAEVNETDLNPFSTAKPVQTDDLKCPVCLDVFLKPVTTSCSHVFCLQCIVNSLEYQEICPLCRMTINLLHLRPLSRERNSVMQAMYKNYTRLLIRCPNCQWKGRMREWGDHIGSNVCNEYYHTPRVPDLSKFIRSFCFPACKVPDQTLNNEFLFANENVEVNKPQKPNFKEQVPEKITLEELGQRDSNNEGVLMSQYHRGLVVKLRASKPGFAYSSQAFNRDRQCDLELSLDPNSSRFSSSSTNECLCNLMNSAEKLACWFLDNNLGRLIRIYVIHQCTKVKPNGKRPPHHSKLFYSQLVLEFQNSERNNHPDELFKSAENYSCTDSFVSLDLAPDTLELCWRCYRDFSSIAANAEKIIAYECYLDQTVAIERIVHLLMEIRDPRNCPSRSGWEYLLVELQRVLGEEAPPILEDGL